MSRPKQPGPLSVCAGECASPVAKEGTHGVIALEGGAVDLNERTFGQMAPRAQGVDAPSKRALSSSGRAREEQRRCRLQGNTFQAPDKVIERPVASDDSALQ